MRDRLEPLPWLSSAHGFKLAIVQFFCSYGCAKRRFPLFVLRCGCGSKPMGSHFGVGAPPILEPILVVGLVDVHWGYDLDFGF